MSTGTQIPVTHVIFDLDGTIINSVDVIIDVLRDYAKSHRKELSPEIESEKSKKLLLF
jgi:beta-phosphoglucomutase-like phosphatase (HAD superfamily)